MSDQLPERRLLGVEMAIAQRRFPHVATLRVGVDRHQRRSHLTDARHASTRCVRCIDPRPCPPERIEAAMRERCSPQARCSSKAAERHEICSHIDASRLTGGNDMTAIGPTEPPFPQDTRTATNCLQNVRKARLWLHAAPGPRNPDQPLPGKASPKIDDPARIWLQTRQGNARRHIGPFSMGYAQPV